MGPCRLRISGMPLCSGLWLGSGLMCVGPCQGPSVLFHNSMGWRGFAKGGGGDRVSGVVRECSSS
jgi:hypothetical protein